jgi:hypothetical protein
MDVLLFLFIRKARRTDYLCEPIIGVEKVVVIDVSSTEEKD